MDLTKKLERELGLAYKRVCKAGANNKKELERFERKITEAERKGFNVGVYRNCLERFKKAAIERNAPPTIKSSERIGWD